MIKIRAILKLLFTNQFILISDKSISGKSSPKFIEKAMFDLMEVSILKIEQEMAVEEAKEILNLIKN